MKKLISILLLLAATTFVCRAQSVTKTMNSIVTTTPTTALTSASSATTSNSIVQVDYFDGLGRPVQTVLVNGSSAGVDLATKQVYDKYGQVIENWLPVPASGNNGAYVSSFNSKSKSAYSNDSYAYTKTEYEPSPLARPVAVYSPGAEMKSHPATIKYTTNYNMNVKKYAMSSKNEIVDKGTYANGSLFVKIEADQDGCTTQTFTDKLGNVILERRVNGSENYDTYYVYSNYDTYDSRYHHSKLCAVMPPGCNVSNYAEAAYIYRYDERHRCVYKKIPGADPVTYVYDNADRLTYSQDGEQRKRGVYTYYSYDSFNRVFSQGECSNTQGSNKTTLVTNYYDNYNFMAYPKFSGMSGGSANTAKGLKTGAIISVLGSPSGVQCEVYSYDYRGRLEKTMVKDVYGKLATYTTDYNFNNQPIQQKEEYSAQGITKTTTYTYDLQGRLTKEYTTVTVSKTTQAAAQVEFVYSNVGRLGSKKIGTTTKTEISYLYNTQGQLLSAASTPFTEKLHYNNSSIPNAKNYFNGNISAIYWKHSGQSANTTIFGYDKLNRMTSSTNTVKANSLTETGFTYDERGNISGFSRYDASSQPTRYYLTHSNANRLVIANTDKGQFWGFSYDANGNQTSAPNGLTITYNSINQPQQVKSGSTVKHKFAYLADGRKLHSISDPANDGGLAYIGSSVFKIYRGKYDGFESTSFSAGRIVRNSSGYAVQYHITDHLGSVRAVLNQSMTVLEQNDYYPFGLRHPNASLKTTANRYRYNGKEEIAADATSDYGARQYSAEFCQWLQVDPLAEKYYSWSPYNFCVGNPLRFVDSDGRKVRFANGSSAEFKTAFAQAVQHLNNHGAGGMLAELEKSDKVYYLSNIGFDDPKGSRFNFKKETIYWNPNGGILTNNGYELSPTSVLNHEIDHALQYDKNPQQFHKDRKTEDSQYTNKEEQRVITGSEQNTAKKLGEINDEEVTREDHRGQLYETTGPTSTEWKNEIIITP
ncbi:MAG: hypothetical protein IKO46_01810 [Salinivirgaceae bacterium]|nr:hypothetical protein [Salinivirgaceae bacterium]